MATVFDDILLKGIRSGQIPARTQVARQWYRDMASGTRGAATRDTSIMRSNKDALRSRPRVGRMYHFYYDPKGKKELPYYDTFPLIFMVGPAQNGFYGINMHYLPLKLRAKLMDSLYDVASNQKFDESTRLRLSYNLLKGASRYKYFKPTFKHYLSSNVRSRFLEINSTEWDIALFLPTERFEKMNKRSVQAQSRKLIT